MTHISRCAPEFQKPYGSLPLGLGGTRGVAPSTKSPSAQSISRIVFKIWLVVRYWFVVGWHDSLEVSVLTHWPLLRLCQSASRCEECRELGGSRWPPRPWQWATHHPWNNQSINLLVTSPSKQRWCWWWRRRRSFTSAHLTWSDPSIAVSSGIDLPLIYRLIIGIVWTFCGWCT